MAGNYSSLAQHLAVLDDAAFPSPRTIITSSTPTDVTLADRLVFITTSDSGDNDVVNIISPPLNDSGLNLDFLGRRIILVVSTQNNFTPVSVTIDGGSTIAATNAYISPIKEFSAVSMASMGDFVSLIWLGSSFALDQSLANPTEDTFGTPAQTTYDLRASSATLFNVDGSAVVVRGGDGITSAAGGNAFLQGGGTSNGTAGSAILEGGHGGGASGVGGNIIINAGTGFDAAHNGLIIIGNDVALPTADPLVVGALWNSTGTLKVSAG